MKLTIIPSDGAVYVDGVASSKLVFSYPAGVHALQWDGEAGHLEFVSTTEFSKPPNQKITELPDWALEAKTKWDEAQSVEVVETVLTYADKRRAEYPPMTDYLDGVVKGDQAQIAAYIAACQAVKAKYPKE